VDLIFITSPTIFVVLIFSSTDFSAGEYDSLPEQAFYMVGAIEEVVEKAARLAEEHSM